ncbi:MAG: hypothetical protein ABEJ60_05280 [Halodesulfurarchaeum sp.]
MFDMGPMFYLLLGGLLVFFFFIYLLIRRTILGFREGVERSRER